MDATAIALILMAVVVVLCCVGLELYRRMQRTRIFQLGGGLRFEAFNFSVQIQRRQQEVRVQCARGVLRAPDAPLASANAQTPSVGRMQCTFAAVGFAAEVKACTKPASGMAETVPSGYFDLVLRGADGTQLTIERVNGTVAASFKYFYLQVRVWIDKLEERIERERVAQLRTQEDAAQAQRDADLLAQLMDGKAPNAALTDLEREAMAAAQIAQWRSTAGFEGQHSLHHTDPKGRVVWFVDLAGDGRITLHADKHTVHTTLRGASVEAILGELEVGVRDAHWTENDTELRTFRILRGRSAEERRAWRERMEIMRNSLNAPS